MAKIISPAGRLARIFSNAKWNGECLEWQGKSSSNGYPRISYRGRSHPGARTVMKLFGHELNDRKIHVCHKCDNRKCINPDHLFLGDATVNNRDMAAKGRHSGQKKTACPFGHEYTKENTIIINGTRSCHQCKLIRMRRDSRKYYELAKLKRK